MSDNRLVRKLFHLLWLLKRPVTLGVRIALMDGGKILLVKHTYVSGWYLPGGGVEPGESALQAANKELVEETGIHAKDPLELFAAYHNRNASRRDHVLLYACKGRWERVREFAPNREIAEAAFFSVDELPADTTSATRKRIAELVHNDIPSGEW